mgnify:FL=1
MHVAAQQFAFSRASDHEAIVVTLNAAVEDIPLVLQVPAHFNRAVELLNGGEDFNIHDGSLTIEAVPARWGRVLRLGTAPG